MRDIGTLVWIVAILIGVISSIVKNARTAGQKPEVVQRRAELRAKLAARRSAIGLGPPLTMEAPVAITLAPVPPPPAAPVAPKAPPPQPAPRREAEPRPVKAPAGERPESVRGMFGRRDSFIRAVIAAQVLGPPKALQEQSIWSPRHSDLSI